MEERKIVLSNCKFYDGNSFTRASIVINKDKCQLNGEIPEGAEIVDCSNYTCIVGLTDFHCHPFDLGFMRNTLDLSNVRNITSLRLRLSSFSSSLKSNSWLIGWNWDHEKFEEKRMPRKEDIDDVTGENPAILMRVCGHVALVNTSAFKILGINQESNLVEKDANGAPTGIIKEEQVEKALEHVVRGKDDCTNDFMNAEYEAVKNGLTSLHCILSPSNYMNELEALLELERSGKLNVKKSIFLPISAIDKKELISSSLEIVGFKIFADGSLGARTAALNEEYRDDKGNFGILRYRDADLRELVQEVDSLGMQAAIHAIGDRAIEQAIDAISSLGKKRRSAHRIEHASLAPPGIVKEIARKNITVTVQPHFVYSEPWAKDRLGERVEFLYPFKSFLKEGVRILGSSDAPVEPINPFLGMWAACIRPGFSEEERLTVREAISIYTRGEMNSQEHTKEGSAFIDLTLVDTDLENIHPFLLRNVRVCFVAVKGKVVYSLF